MSNYWSSQMNCKDWNLQAWLTNRKFRTSPNIFNQVQLLFSKSNDVCKTFSVSADGEQSLQSPAVCLWRVTGLQTDLWTSGINLDPQKQSESLFLLWTQSQLYVWPSLCVQRDRNTVSHNPEYKNKYIKICIYLYIYIYTIKRHIYTYAHIKTWIKAQ